MFLAVFPHLELAHSLEQIGFETHRASLNALAATDTVLFLRADGLRFGQEEQTAEAFVSRHVFDMIHRATHHRTTADDLTGIYRNTTCEGDDLFDRRTETNGVVTRFEDFLTRDGHNAADERFVLLNCLVNSIDGSYVIYHCTHFDRQRTRRNLTADTSIDELFLTALRVFEFERNNIDAQFAVRQLGHVLDGIFLVVLDADDSTVHTKGTFENLDTDDDLFAMLHHELVVTGEVRFALYAVDDEHFGFLTRRGKELDVCRETSATETYDTCSRDLVDDGFGLKGT